jgi:hypothetical protein
MQVYRRPIQLAVPHDAAEDAASSFVGNPNLMSDAARNVATRMDQGWPLRLGPNSNASLDAGMRMNAI